MTGPGGALHSTSVRRSTLARPALTSAMTHASARAPMIRHFFASVTREYSASNGDRSGWGAGHGTISRPVTSNVRSTEARRSSSVPTGPNHDGTLRAPTNELGLTGEIPTPAILHTHPSVGYCAETTGTPGGASLLAPLGLSHAEVASAVTARIDKVGPPVRKEFEGCLSAPTYHTILGRAEGFAFGSGRSLSEPADFLAALFWDPAGTPSELLATVGRSRSAVLDIVTGSGRRLPLTPTTNPLAAPADREAVVLGHSFFGDEHVVLALLADEPDDRAGQALHQAGVAHDRLATRLAHMVANCDPPVPPSRDVGSARPNPRCRQLMGRAEVLAAMLGDGVGRLHRWPHRLPVAGRRPARLGTGGFGYLSDGGIACARRARRRGADVAAPSARPHALGERVYVPAERMKDVVARLSADLPPGMWGCNSHEGREWVVAHAVIDLAGIVDDVLAS